MNALKATKTTLCLGLVAQAFLVLSLATSQAIAVESTSIQKIEKVTTPKVERKALLLEDIDRKKQGLPLRFATKFESFITPELDGTWETLENGNLRWSLVVESPNAISINLGFTQFKMPEHGRMLIYSSDGSDSLRPFTAADNSPHDQLWTPPVLTSEIIIEVELPANEKNALSLELTSINGGYRDQRSIIDQFSPKRGSCQNDVACPEAAAWQEQSKSVCVLQMDGWLFCSGSMINNSAQDGRPLLLTAYHCGIQPANAASVIAYYNFQTPACGSGSGSLNQFVSGSTYLAGEYYTDFCLVELDEIPPIAYDVVLNGWNRTDAMPSSTVSIHHPDCDEKSISWDYDAAAPDWYYFDGPDDTHFMVIWDDGTTEHGSSGSPLFSQDHYTIGWLSGGWSACGADQYLPDWYGRLFYAWNGGNETVRLKDWLDPENTNALTVPLLPYRNMGLTVSGDTNSVFEGPIGGPFAPESISFEVGNISDKTITFSANTTAPWIQLDTTTGTLAPDQTMTVIGTLTPNANALDGGQHPGSIVFANTTTGSGTIVKSVWLNVIDCNNNNVNDATDIADGTSQDCNKNTIPDECEIADGTASDCNHNNIPDECEVGVNPTVVQSPVDKQYIEGQAIVLTVDATGYPPLAYQWRKDGAKLVGETTPSLVINPAKLTDSGDYDVIINSPCGVTYSVPATVDVVPTLAATIKPEKTIIAQGDSTKLSVNIIGGTGPFTYLWSTGERTPTINVAPAGTTTYSVVVTDDLGQAAEAVFATTVVDILIAQIEASATTIEPGEAVVLTADSNWTVAPISYQWSTGATTKQITLTPATTMTVTLTATDPIGQQSTAEVTINVQTPSDNEPDGNTPGDGNENPGDGNENPNDGNAGQSTPTSVVPTCPMASVTLFATLFIGLLRSRRAIK